MNGLRGHLTEISMIAPQGPRYARDLAGLIEACDERIPFEVCEALAELVHQLHRLIAQRVSMSEVAPSMTGTSSTTITDDRPFNE
jgi:hypothetical protein